MVYRTLQYTKDATYAVCPPHPILTWKGFPYPAGTGFFISPDGYFLTARHVVMMLEVKDGKVVPKLDNSGNPLIHPASAIWLQKPMAGLIQNLTKIQDWPQYDLILYKADFNKIKGTRGFEEKTHFDFLELDNNVIPEGTEVYSFGYPLTEYDVQSTGSVMIGTINWFPRATSAMISSHYHFIGSSYGMGPSPYYVVDKALNPGNSGGPIILRNGGKAISVCTSVQTFKISGQASIILPSNYSLTIATRNIQDDLIKLGIV